MFGKEKLYKFVYEKSGHYSWERGPKLTLLVTAKNAIRAVNKFYDLAGSGVTNIVEFTEIKYPEGNADNEKFD